MRPLQILTALVTLILCLSVVAWLNGRPPKPKPPAPVQPPPAVEKPAEKTETVTPAPERDYFEANPFRIAKEGPFPFAQVQQPNFDFGAIVLGKSSTREFVLRNEGDAPLKLAKGPAQCKCTVAGLKEQEISPGGETTIELKWTPSEPGPFYQLANFWTNDPKSPTFALAVEGFVYPALITEPENGWSLGSLSAGSVTNLHGAVKTIEFDTFEITKIDSPPEIQLEATPFTEDDREQGKVKWGYRLSGTLTGGEKSGPFNGIVTVHTNLEEYPSVQIFASANFTGPLMVIGPGWYAEEQVLKLGNIDVNVGKKVKLTFMTTPAEEELKVLSVQSIPPGMRVTVQPEQTGKELPRERYTVFLEVPKDSPRGIWREGSWGKLVLKTNHPDLEEVTFKIGASIR